MFKRIFKRLEDIYAAAAFAEEGEFDIARKILMEDKRPEKVDRITPVKRIRKELRAPGIQR